MTEQEQLKNELEARAIVDNLVMPIRQKLKDGLVQVPFDKILKQVQYLQNIALPTALSKYGQENENYLFYKGLVDSLLWAMVSSERADFFRRELGHQKYLTEFFETKCRRYEEQLAKYQLAEDGILNQQDFDQLMNEVRQRINDINPKS